MSKKKVKKKAVKKGKRLSFKAWVKKYLDKAHANIKKHKFVPTQGKIETHEEGIERTRKLETAQAVFDAIREMHDAL
jgi:virulence-associated protein VapD